MKLCKTCLVSKMFGNNTYDHIGIGDRFSIVPFHDCKALYHPSSIKIPKTRIKWIEKKLSLLRQIFMK